MSRQRSAFTTYVLGGGGMLLGSMMLAASLLLTSVLSQVQTMEQIQAEAVAISEQSGAFTTNLYRASAELLIFVATGQLKDRDEAHQELRDAHQLAAALREHDVLLATLTATPLTDEQEQLHRQRLAVLQQLDASEQALREATAARDQLALVQALIQLDQIETKVEAIEAQAQRRVVQAQAQASRTRQQAAQHILSGVGGLFAVLMLIVLGVLVLVQHLLVRPLVRLADAASQVAAGQRGHLLAVTGSGEIGTLQRRFNEMLEALSEADAAVVEHTQELAVARDQALLASQHEAEQNAYLAALHDTTLDLLNHQAPDELFQAIVERAAAILDAPYCELMLCEDDVLVVQAVTPNQTELCGERVGRQEAVLSWQAFDTRQPAVLEDYAAWPQRRAVYDPMGMHAVADFPILVGQECRGVLALGRTQPDYPFAEDAIGQGMQFARLIALVLEQVRLYNLALAEIAERTQAEQALQQLAAELQAQNEDLDAFARTVAHDLKIPLTNVIGYSQMLLTHRDTLEPGQEQEFLEIISTTGRKMSGIVNDLLLLARVRTLESVPITDVPMERVVAEVLRRLSLVIVEAQATIVAPGQWPRSVGYAPWVEEVWTNYLSNAIKYGGQPPRVVLGADSEQGGLVRFWVEDNGQGLSEEQCTQIFAPFTRFHTGQAAGHGLGLSIVERIVTKLGGTVGVESESGKGSRFFFTLPAEHPALFAERTA